MGWLCRKLANLDPLAPLCSENTPSVHSSGTWWTLYESPTFTMCGSPSRNPEPEKLDWEGPKTSSTESGLGRSGLGSKPIRTSSGIDSMLHRITVRMVSMGISRCVAYLSLCSYESLL